MQLTLEVKGEKCNVISSVCEVGDSNYVNWNCWQVCANVMQLYLKEGEIGWRKL